MLTRRVLLKSLSALPALGLLFKIKAPEADPDPLWKEGLTRGLRLHARTMEFHQLEPYSTHESPEEIVDWHFSGHGLAQISPDRHTITFLPLRHDKISGVLHINYFA